MMIIHLQTNLVWRPRVQSWPAPPPSPLHRRAQELSLPVHCWDELWLYIKYILPLHPRAQELSLPVHELCNCDCLLTVSHLEQFCNLYDECLLIFRCGQQKIHISCSTKDNCFNNYQLWKCCVEGYTQCWRVWPNQERTSRGLQRRKQWGPEEVATVNRVISIGTDVLCTAPISAAVTKHPTWYFLGCVGIIHHLL